MPVCAVYFGNSGSAFSAWHFKALLKAPCDLAAVVDVPLHRRGTTNPLPDRSSNLVELAHDRGIQVFEPGSPNEMAFVDALREVKPDLFIAAGYSLILKEAVLSVPRILAANFHASLLPEYRGKHPVFWALRNGEQVAGLTVHTMDPGIDTGDILYQVRVNVKPDDTVETLYDRIMTLSTLLMERLVRDANFASIPRRPQIKGAGSYYSSTKEDDFRLDWRWPAEQIRRYIKITPGKCFTDTDFGRVFFLDAQLEPVDGRPEPGTLIEIDEERAVIATGKGAISGQRVQAGGEVQALAGFCRRAGLGPGDRLVLAGSV